MSTYRLNVDFHALTSDEVEAVLRAAEAAGYRKPKNANGSRARRCAADSGPVAAGSSMRARQRSELSNTS
jgi:hypothetical protein